MTETLTPPRERIRRDTGSGTGDAWRVIVLNDSHNTFEGVAFALAQTIPGVDYDRGMALATKSFRWEGFTTTEDLVNHVVGGILMGFGGVTALGCTIGQGLSGVSTRMPSTPAMPNVSTRVWSVQNVRSSIR